MPEAQESLINYYAERFKLNRQKLSVILQEKIERKEKYIVIEANSTRRMLFVLVISP